jgi:hypothetical protein
VTSVRLSLQPVSLTVDPGGQTTCTVTVKNTGTIVELFAIAVVGAPSMWAEVSPPAISLLPDDERTVTVTFRPPRGPVPNAATLPFAVKIIPSKQSDDTAVEEGDVTVTPFFEVAPAMRPRASRGATVGHHVLRVTNRGNTPIDVVLTASDPDELLKSRVRPEKARIPPGATAAARVDVRPRQVKYLGQQQPVPFQARVQRANAPPVLVDGSFIQRPVLPRWLPRAAVVVAAVAVGTVLYASKAAQVKNVAVPASATSTTSTTITKPTNSTGPTQTTVGGGGGLTTTTSGGTTATSKGTGGVGAAALTEAPGDPNVTCTPYDPNSVTVSQAAAPITTTSSTPAAAGTSTTTAGVVYNVTTNNPPVAFQFTQQIDATVAVDVLRQYQQMCLITGDGILATQLMVLEPVQSSFQFPKIPNAQENCQPYNNAKATLQAVPVNGTFELQDQTTNPPTFIQSLDSNSDAQTARKIALAHTNRCWIGGGNTFSCLDATTNGGKAPPYPVLEYWK